MLELILIEELNVKKILTGLLLFTTLKSNNMRSNAAPIDVFDNQEFEPRNCSNSIRSILKLYNGRVFKFDEDKSVNSADVENCVNFGNFGTQQVTRGSNKSCLKVDDAVRQYEMGDSGARVLENLVKIRYSKFCIRHASQLKNSLGLRMNE